MYCRALNLSPPLQMSVPPVALAARRVIAAASHSSHEGGGKCVFTVSLTTTNKTEMHQRLQIQSVCMQQHLRVVYSWSLLLIINWNVCRSGRQPLTQTSWQMIRKYILYWHGLCILERTAAMSFFTLFSVLQSCTFTGCVFHSEDLEDTELCFGHSWCCRLHGQRVHEDAGDLAWAARICAISSPAYPHQGESQTACTGIYITPRNITGLLLTFLCLLAEIPLGRWKPLSDPQRSHQRSAQWLRGIPSLRGSVTFLSCVLLLI